MVTGIECAGLALAVIPLVVEIAKVYPQGIKTVKDTLQPARFEAALEEFYEELFCQMFEFHERMQRIFEHLPGLSQAQKAQLTYQFTEADWKPGTNVANAFATIFPTQGGLFRFETIVKRVIKQMGQLIEDKAVYMSKMDATTDLMYAKLKTFQASRGRGSIDSSWKRRFSFSVKQRDREKSLQMVDKWNEKLKDLVTDFDRSHSLNSDPQKKRSLPPFARIQQLAIYLFDALASHWTCTCVQERSAKFLLQSHCTSSIDDDDVPFQLLFSRQRVLLPRQLDRKWLEGRVTMRQVPSPKGTAKFKISSTTLPNRTADPRQRLKDVCEAVEPAEMHGHRLCLLIEIGSSSQTAIWRLKAEPCNLRLTDSTREISLADILVDLSRNHRARSWIAVQLAHSLVQLHHTPWLGATWMSDQVSFFEAAPGQPDFERPYVTVNFPGNPLTQPVVDLNQFHENASILSLGIVLIEMHTGQSIANLRIPDDLRGSPSVDCNALYRTAERVFRKIRLECSLNYEKAMRACLEVSWKVAGQAVSLMDEATRQKVHQHIICPLEDDQDILGGHKLTGRRDEDVKTIVPEK